MAVYTGVPTVPVLYLRPTGMRFDIPGSAEDGGRNGLGQSISRDISGGGEVTATYSRCFVGSDDTERHEVVNWLGARGNGSFRFFNVPIINDGIGPFPIINGKRRPIIDGIPHSDGSLFSDGAGYSQATVWAKFRSLAALNAGQITIRIYEAARDLRWSDWFSVYHPIKGWRAYRYWESDKTAEGSETVGGVVLAYKDYTLGIGPPLREAVTAETRIEFARPMCVMKFPPGFSLPWDVEGWLQSRPTLEFVEAW